MLFTGRAARFCIVASLVALGLNACGKPPAQEQGCTAGSCTEQSINAPLVPQPSTPPDQKPLPPTPPPPQGFQLPPFDPDWGLTPKVYAKALSKQQLLAARAGNSRYFIVIDFNLPSSKKRFFLFDLATGKVERHLVAHGAGSDPNKTGYATRFSNEAGSKMSSVGLYVTTSIYYGKNGRSLRLRGLERTNSNAEERAIVMHPADYVDESRGYAGRSWGCPALDPRVADGVIRRVHGGTLLLIDR